MLPPGFVEILGRLDPGTLTALVRALLQAEAARMGMAADALTISERVNDVDGGLDAELDGVPPDQLLPEGLCGFQLKASKTKAPSRLSLDEELEKPLVVDLFARGGTYVLVWPQQFNPQQKQKATDKLAEARPAGHLDAAVRLLDGQGLLAICEHHVQIIQGFGLAEFGPMRSLAELGEQLRIEERPYQPDPEREQAITQLRALAAASEEEAQVAAVLGLSGVGKTRLVHEALDDDQLRDCVLYTDSSDDLDAFVGYLLREARTSGILVADEIEVEAATRVQRRLDGTRGRWRLVTVSSIVDQRPHPSGARDIVLRPLRPDATTALVMRSDGLNDVAAGMVAEVASGFPSLAFALAKAKIENPDLNLIELANLHQTSQLLERALPDPALREALAPLALFRGLGVAGELAHELDAVATLFGLDASRLRAVIEKERRQFRFVSAAGDYRSVSPTLVAVWLATDLLEATPDLDVKVPQLPQAVQDAFYDQIELFGDSSEQLNESLRRLLESSDRFRRPEDFDEAAARLVRAAVAAVPGTVAEQLCQLLSHSTDSQLERLPRRPLVSTLVELLWHATTWERAIDGLLVLALHETESWSNNATGQFQHFFSLVLAGTTVPHRDRIGWLRSRINAATDDASLCLFAQAAARSFNDRPMRVRANRFADEPDDWSPTSRQDVEEAYRSATECLLTCLDRVSQSRVEVVGKALGSGLFPLARTGLVGWLGQELAVRELDDSARSQLLGDAARAARVIALRGEAGSAEADPSQLTELADLIRIVEGQTLEAKLRAVLGARAWDLATSEDEMSGTPERLQSIADGVAEKPDEFPRLLEIGRDLPNQQMRYRLWGLVAAKVGAERVGQLALRDGVVTDEPALAAALSAADQTSEGRWATGVLEELMDGPDPDQGLRMTLSVDTTAERLAMVIDKAEAVGASLAPLANLALGARAAALEKDLQIRLLRGLLDAELTESALTIAVQILEERRPSAEMQILVGEIAESAAQDASRTSTSDYLVGKLVADGLLDQDQVMRLWEWRLRNPGGLIEEADEILTRAALEIGPQRALEATMRLIDAEASGEAIFSLLVSRDLHLLARLSDALGAETIVREFEKLGEDAKRIAVHHMQWGGEVPHSLTRLILTSEAIGGLEVEAATCFFNTLGTVSGKYWRALEGERERALGWLEDLKDTSGAAWAKNLVEYYSAEIERHQKREAEEDFRRGA